MFANEKLRVLKDEKDVMYSRVINNNAETEK
jgi:hypothetical protein